MADVLFGSHNPSGKLPVTFYKSTSQLPDYEDYSMRGRTYRYFDDPLFAFGFGLSYTSFETGKAVIEGSNGDFTLNIPVSNTGRRDGTETVQVYIRNTSDPDGPLKSLRGFQRISVKAGQTATAQVRLTRKSFEFFDVSTNTMRTKPGTYEILYGNSSLNADLKSLEVTLR